MSASAVARLRAVVARTENLPASNVAVMLDPLGLDTESLTVGDLRALLNQLDTMERALVVMQTPSDNERRQFIRAFVIEHAHHQNSQSFAGAILDARAAWALLLKEDC